MDQPLVASLVICTLNRPEEIVQCVSRIVRQSRLPKELIVVDAGELGQVREGLAGMCRHAGIEFRYCQTTPSTTRQRNRGAELASGDVIFFVDDDVELSDDYLEVIMRVYEADDERAVGGVTGVASGAPVPGKSLWRVFNRLFLQAEVRVDTVARLKPSHLPILATALSETRRTELMPSTAVSYRADVFRAHRFDGDLTGYVMAEDLDLSYRVSRRHKLLAVPAATYAHKKSPKSRNSMREAVRRRVLFTQYFFRKNMGRVPARWLARYWALLGMGLRYGFICLRERKPQPLLGYFDGLRAAWKNRLLWPGRFSPGELEL